MELRPGYKQTEVGAIPIAWDVKPLSALPCKVIDCHHSTPVWTSSGVVVIRNQNIRAGKLDLTEPSYTDEKHYRERVRRALPAHPDLVITREAPMGQVCMISPELKCCLGQRMVLLRIRQEFANSLYVLYALQAEQVQRAIAIAGGTGSTVSNLRIPVLKSLPIPTPDRREQRAIAEALSDVDGLLGGLERLIAKKRDLKQAAMQQLLTSQTRLPGFTSEWEEFEFGEVSTIRNVKVAASSMPAGTVSVELESIEQDSGRLRNVSEAAGISSKYKFEKGDVLFGRLRAYLRKYWLAAFDGICSTEIWPLTPRDGRLCAPFLHLIVQTSDFVSAAGVSYGTHMPRSDWAVLKCFPVRLPPAPEQFAIAAAIADMDAELAALEARRDKTRALKQAMMQELLTGRTRLV